MTYSETRFAQAGETYTPPVGGAWNGWIAGVFIALFLAAVGYGAWGELQAGQPAYPTSTVKVELAQGHGSGVHIGDGLILSAAHVAGDGETVTLKLDDGTTRSATVVWASTKLDIALLRTSPDGLAASPLSCAPVVVGQAITARGNPLVLEFITTYGHIVGVARPLQDWTAVAPVDMVILPGMSGGPSFNEAGEVVGINVAVLTAPIGISASFTGLGMIVPASNICGLLGRT